MLRNAALLAAAVFVSLVLGEVALRAAGRSPPPIGVGPAPAGGAGFGWAEPDAVVGWKNRPGVQRWTPPNDAPMTFLPDHRRASFAGDDRPGARVVLVGCSFTAGLGVADADTFAWRLNESWPALRVENHATSGWSTWQALRRAEQLVAEDGARPALVVYAYIGNHDQRNVARWQWIEGLETLRPGTHLVPPHVTLDGDALVEQPLAILEPWPGEGRSAWIGLAHELTLRARFHRSKEMRRRVTELLLLRFAAALREAEVPLLVALLADVDPDSELPRFLAEHRIDFVDCELDGWRRDDAVHLANDVHPSPLAHERWTACVGAAIDARIAPR
jgi:hypothetical protein